MIQAVVNFHYFSKVLFQRCGQLQLPGQVLSEGEKKSLN